MLQHNNDPEGGIIYGYHVNDPQRYGVVEFDEMGKAISIEEKPKHPKSNYAIPGIYFYDNEVIQIVGRIKPSQRGELEITDINKAYLQMGKLKVSVLDRGTAWLDTGTHGSLLDAGNFVRTLQSRQGMQTGCPEEIAYLQGWIDDAALLDLADRYEKTEYGAYLRGLQGTRGM